MSCYVVSHITVNDAEAYKGYTAHTPATVSAHGSKFIVRGGESCLLYTSPSPRDRNVSRMPSSA